MKRRILARADVSIADKLNCVKTYSNSLKNEKTIDLPKEIIVMRNYWQKICDNIKYKIYPIYWIQIVLLN